MRLYPVAAKRKRLIIFSFVCAVLIIGVGAAEEEAKVIDGLCYGPFREGQEPPGGPYPTEEQIRQDLRLISKLTSTIRTYGNDDILDSIPRWCPDYGIDCWACAFISGNTSTDLPAISKLIQLANENHSTTKGLIVGNEAVSGNHIDTEGLIYYIDMVKSGLADTIDIPVTTAESWYLYYSTPELVEAVDCLFIHIQPFGDGIIIDYAAQYVIDLYNIVHDTYTDTYPGKAIIIGETSWPTDGGTIDYAVAGEENQEKFLFEFRDLADSNNIKYFFLAPFDEPWKGPRDFEPHLGLLYEDRTPKLAMRNLLPGLIDIIGRIKDIALLDDNDTVTFNITSEIGDFIFDLYGSDNLDSWTYIRPNIPEGEHDIIDPGIHDKQKRFYKLLIKNALN